MTSANSWFGMGPPPRYVATRHAGGSQDASRDWAQLGRRWGYAKDPRGPRNAVSVMQRAGERGPLGVVAGTVRTAPAAVQGPGARNRLSVVAGTREDLARAEPPAADASDLRGAAAGAHERAPAPLPHGSEQ